MERSGEGTAALSDPELGVRIDLRIVQRGALTMQASGGTTAPGAAGLLRIVLPRAAGNRVGS